MEIADAYRKARRNTSIFCGISLAWSAAQFDLKSLNIDAAGRVDISGASISIILVCLVVYTMVQCTIEFMMQPNEIRRWNLAQIDYRITLNLVRISLLTIAAATASRSIETVVGVIVAALAFIFSYFALVSVLMLIIAPLIIYIRSRQGRFSVASYVGTALNWSMFIVVIFYFLIFITIGFSSVENLPFFSLLPPIPKQISTIFFAATAIIITISFLFEWKILKKVFAFEPEYNVIEKKLPDGNIGVKFEKNPNHPDYVAPSPPNETVGKNSD